MHRLNNIKLQPWSRLRWSEVPRMSLKKSIWDPPQMLHNTHSYCTIKQTILVYWHGCSPEKILLYTHLVQTEHNGLMPLPLERIGRLRTQIARGLRSSLCTAGLTLLACGALTADCKATPPTRPLLAVPWWLLLRNMISNLHHTWLNFLFNYGLISSIKFRGNSL
jgi:hypothetical protein